MNTMLQNAKIRIVISNAKDFKQDEMNSALESVV